MEERVFLFIRKNKIVYRFNFDLDEIFGSIVIVKMELQNGGLIRKYDFLLTVFSVVKKAITYYNNLYCINFKKFLIQMKIKLVRYFDSYIIYVESFSKE